MPERCLFHEDGCFGDLEVARQTDKNPRIALQNLMQKTGMDVTYEEAEGLHNWAFWNSQIPKILDWQPLDGGSLGMDSGNVKV